jgi:hypothetical protein
MKNLKARIFSRNDFLLKIIDKLFILFIYLNIVSPGPNELIFNTKKILFGLTFFLYLFHLMLKNQRVSRCSLLFILFIFASIMSLAQISLLKGNEISNILIFITPLFFFLYIFILNSLNKMYSIEKYLKHIAYSGVILSLIIVGIVVITNIFNFKAIALLLIGENGQPYSNIAVSFPQNILRVNARTGVFLSVSLCISLYFYKSSRDKLFVFFALLILIATYFTRSIGIWAGVTLVVVMSFFKKRQYAKNTFVLLAFFVGTIVLLNTVIAQMREDENKDLSFRVKQQQVISGIDLFLNKPILGQGLGYIFKDMDERSDYSEPIIENTPVLILATGGILGFFIYAFIFLCPVILYFLQQRKQEFQKTLIISHLSVILAGFSNPYMLAGGMGFFLIVLYLGFRMPTSFKFA